MTLRAPLALGFLALLTSATLGSAQTTVIDEGTFRITVRGSAIGTETFTIRRSGAGANANTVAQGRTILDTGDQTRTVLQFRGTELRPTAYQIEVTGDNRQSITGRAAGNRFRATVVSTTGEQMREYLIDDNAVIIDDGVAHQHYFIAVAVDGDGSVPIIVPRQSRQAVARVRDGGTETVQVGGRQVTAHRLAIEIAGMDDRTLWVDDRDRVLRLHIPQQDLTAERTTLP